MILHRHACITFSHGNNKFSKFLINKYDFAFSLGAPDLQVGTVNALLSYGLVVKRMLLPIYNICMLFV